MTLRAMVLAIVLAGLMTAPAAAGTVSVESVFIPGHKYEAARAYETMTYAAAPGEANDMQVALDAGVLTVSDVAGVQAAAGCVNATPTDARCAIPHGFGALSIVLGDGDDRFTSTLTGRVQGGPGDDTLRGDRLDGGPGDDVLHGREVEGGPGADVIAAQTVSYAGATAAVSVDLNDLTVAGQAGEGDRLDPAVENVSGGRFADVLVGDGRANVLVGGAGDDRIEGRGGDDRIEGRSGADRVAGQDGDDVLFAGSGADRVEGGRGDDWLSGDGGADAMRAGPGRDSAHGGAGADRVDGGPGTDSVDGDGGEDSLISRDGQFDVVRCLRTTPADRRSRVRADSGDLVQGCERVQRPGSARPHIVRVTQDIDQRRAVRVDAGCSQDQRRGCRIGLRVVIGGRVVNRRVVYVAPGNRWEPGVMVPSALYRAGTRNCRRMTATVLVTMRDAAGRRLSQRRRASLRSGSRACAP